MAIAGRRSELDAAARPGVPGAFESQGSQYVRVHVYTILKQGRAACVYMCMGVCVHKLISLFDELVQGCDAIRFRFCVAELLDSLRPASPLPSARSKTPSGGDSQGQDSSSGKRAPGKDVRERFLRINVRHITDGQVYCIHH
jgi:hypothetical protein